MILFTDLVPNWEAVLQGGSAAAIITCVVIMSKEANSQRKDFLKSNAEQSEAFTSSLAALGEKFSKEVANIASEVTASNNRVELSVRALEAVERQKAEALIRMLDRMENKV